MSHGGVYVVGPGVNRPVGALSEAQGGCRACVAFCAEEALCGGGSGPSARCMIRLESRVPENGTPGSEGRRWKRTYGSLIEGRSESDGIPTGSYGHRATS